MRRRNEDQKREPLLCSVREKYSNHAEVCEGFGGWSCFSCHLSTIHSNMAQMVWSFNSCAFMIRISQFLERALWIPCPSAVVFVESRPWREWICEKHILHVRSSTVLGCEGPSLIEQCGLKVWECLRCTYSTRICFASCIVLQCLSNMIVMWCFSLWAPSR